MTFRQRTYVNIQAQPTLAQLLNEHRRHERNWQMNVGDPAWASLAAKNAADCAAVRADIARLYPEYDGRIFA